MCFSSILVFFATDHLPLIHLNSSQNPFIGRHYYIKELFFTILTFMQDGRRAEPSAISY